MAQQAVLPSFKIGEFTESDLSVYIAVTQGDLIPIIIDSAGYVKAGAESRKFTTNQADPDNHLLTTYAALRQAVIDGTQIFAEYLSSYVLAIDGYDSTTEELVTGTGTWLESWIQSWLGVEESLGLTAHPGALTGALASDNPVTPAQITYIVGAPESGSGSGSGDPYISPMFA